MPLQTFDIIVIGAGMAGASTSAFLAPHRRVALLEAEESAGYHTTGRSAALWTANYGPPDVRLLTRLSRGFFEIPPDGFTAVPLMRRRPVLFLAAPNQMTDLDRTLAEGAGLRRITQAEAKAIQSQLDVQMRENGTWKAQIALLQSHTSQVVQRGCDAAPVSQFPPDREALFVQRPGRGNISLLQGHTPQVVQ